MERRTLANRWETEQWEAVAVIPDTGNTEPRLISEDSATTSTGTLITAAPTMAKPAKAIKFTYLRSDTLLERAIEFGQRFGLLRKVAGLRLDYVVHLLDPEQ